MNKKFSTLAAVALLAGSFSTGTYANAVSVSVPVTQEATTKAAAEKFKKDIADINTDVAVLSGYAANARLVMFGSDLTAAPKFVKVAAGAAASAESDSYTDVSDAPTFYFTFENGNFKSSDKATVLTVGNYTSFEKVPVYTTDATPKATPYFVLKVVGKDTYVKSLTDAGATAAEAALFASVDTDYKTVVTESDLNKILGNGFEISIAVAKGSSAEIKGAAAFDGTLKATAGTESAVTAYYTLTQGGNADKTVIFDPEAKIGTNGTEKGQFKVVKASDLDATKASMYYQIFAADNGTDGLKVVVTESTATTKYNMVVSSLSGTNVLTALKDADVKVWPYIKFGNGNSVDLKTLLKGQFVKIGYVANGKENTTDTDNKYKVDGILSVRYNAENQDNEADYVAKSSVIAEAPEAQWALTYDGSKLTLTNRENTTVSLNISLLRTTDKAGVYKVTSDGSIDGDLITISFVENHKKTDGYKVFAENVLRNKTYFLGQSRQTADGDLNAYWAENHGTHQIGATVDEELATKWNLALVKKTADKHTSEIDSILVESKMNVWNATTGTLSEKKDTLVILPYAFQNRENREFVKMNKETNLNYYICNDKNITEANGDAQRFALKLKPNDTYNYVAALTTTNVKGNNTVLTYVGKNKVYQANSTEKGTWADMQPYDGDANSLMVVKEVADPEYRKIKIEWGDTISICRQENDAQKLYEKADVKSVVNNDTLSFLNIDNEYQFKMNPAIFADTAYINRGTGENANTCYQYLLVVEPSFGYHTEGCGVPGHPQTVGAIDTVYGRFLVNLIDTANIYGATHLHNNPYINKIEADEDLAKLSFVEGFHTGDKLYIPRQNNTDTLVLDMNSSAFNVAKFAFRYVDNEAGTFKIQTQWKEYAPTTEEKDRGTSQEGYLRWVNGTVVVTEGYTNGDVFNMSENVKLDPVANETIEAASTISVVATDGAVIVKGAAGKTVTISNVLGQTIANTVLSSDEATIAAPAGVVVVAVEGEAAVKAIVK